jgi:hypothetical protein
MQYIVSYRYRFPLLPQLQRRYAYLYSMHTVFFWVFLFFSFVIKYPVSSIKTLSLLPLYPLPYLEISCCVASRRCYSRKEVFQPHLPVRLPCYDLAPVIGFTLGRSLRLHTLGTPNFHGLTGGVYKARERIHRVIADTRLLANPTSWGRVADPNPNCEWLCEIRIPLPASCPLYHPL